MFTEELKTQLAKILKELQIDVSEESISLEHPALLEHGDYSTNIALKVKMQKSKGKSEGQNSKLDNPRQSAETIVNKWREIGLPEFVEKVEVAGAGFINIWLRNSALSKQLERVLEKGEEFGKNNFLQGKKILLEHTSPNTNKSLHVGHVRNNLTGMAVANILEFCGADLTIDCLFNDRGIHICKAMWGYLYEKSKVKSQKAKVDGGWEELINYWFTHQDEWPSPEDEGEKPDHFVEKFYALGVKAEEDEGNKREMQEILLAWENNDEKVRALWKKLNDWVYQGFEETFKQLGSRYDHAWHESDFYKQAKETIKEGLEKGVFKKLDDGAVLTNLEKMGLTDTIVQRADGTSMYFTQDIYLTKQKTEKFPSDKYIWVVGPEQQLHLKQVFAVCEQMGIGKREDFLHLWYGFVYLKGKGKMSSRAGTVISADELLIEAKRLAGELIKEENVSKEEKEKISAGVGTGAVKYGLLKLGRTQDVYFDWEESLNLKGNSGPYLQYTFARTQSVLAKSKRVEEQESRNGSIRAKEQENWKVEGIVLSSRANPPAGGVVEGSLSSGAQKKGIPPCAALSRNDESNEEIVLLRTIYRFGEIVEEAAREYSPNILCNFLFDLSQKFNLFYDKQRIVGSDNENFRLLLTAGVGQVLKNGLTLLGIEALEKM